MPKRSQFEIMARASFEHDQERPMNITLNYFGNKMNGYTDLKTSGNLGIDFESVAKSEKELS